MKGVIMFHKKGKFSPQFIGRYRIAITKENVAYKIELPQELAAIHSVFHISLLKKFIGDPSFIVPTKNDGNKHNLSYEEIPVQIFDRQVCKLRTKKVALVNVLWRNQFIEEDTQEAKEYINKTYPRLIETVEDAVQDTNSLLSIK